MAGEKANYREVLAYLAQRYPLLLNKGQAAEVLGVSRPHLAKMIKRNHIKEQDGKIPIGSIASYLCG